MVSRRVCLGLIASLPAVARAHARPSDATTAAVYQPSYIKGTTRVASGKGFTVTHGGRILMLTAQHIFGPAGGFDREYAFADLGRLFDVMEARSLSDPGRILRSSRMLDVGGKAVSDWDDVRNDLAVFAIEPQPTGTTTLPLVGALPKPGETVWMLSQAAGKPELVHQATIALASERIVQYAFAEAIDLRGTSGAPVVNQKGEVVAINLGSGKNGDQVYGLGGSSIGIRAKLASAR